MNALRREVKSLELQLLAAQSGQTGVTNSYRRNQQPSMMLGEADIAEVAMLRAENERLREALTEAEEKVRSSVTVLYEMIRN